MTATLQINPTPPSSVVPNLINLNDKLSINYYSLNNNLININLQIDQ
jgi:hypothetical protein